MNSLTLLPVPREFTLGGSSYPLLPDRRIALVGVPAQELMFSGERLQQALYQAGLHWTLAATTSGPREETGAVLAVDPSVGGVESYELDIAEQGIQVRAGSPHGIFNAVCTLVQIVEQSAQAGVLPFLHILDRPDFPNRGVLLDISRDKVPTMATLFDLVDLLASWKVNQLQLYTEHTFAYRRHRVVWEHASPLAEQEILEFDRFCRERFIELVPNQNSFGHLRRWLVHEPYRDLAEAPNGCDTVWGHFDEPFSLNPTDPRSLALLRELFDELLPNFTSRQFNVGCDETVDLGKDRSRAECEARGTGRVYLDFLQEIYREVKGRGYTMQFWGDMVVEHPDLVSELPKDAIALEWGYEADHPFAEDAAAFARAGLPFYVCPGTSTWNSFAGRTDNAVKNILNAAENGLQHGAIGLLNTDWGDNGHWQYLPFSYLGFAYGAALGWAVQANRDLDLPCVLDQFAFRDRARVMGRMAYDLGNVYRETGIQLHNSSALSYFIHQPLEKIRGIEGLARESLECTAEAVGRALGPLARQKMERADAGLVQKEFEQAGRLMQHAVRRGLLALDTTGRVDALKRELAGEWAAIMQTHRELWHARNRPGGFEDSFARMQWAARAYE